MKTQEQRIQALEQIAEEQHRLIMQMHNEIASLRYQLRDHKHVQGEMTFGATASIAHGFGGPQP